MTYMKNGKIIISMIFILCASNNSILFRQKALVKELSRFQNAEIIWCQEEPYNMGAWYYISRNIEWVLERIKTKSKKLKYVGRSAAAAPASGSLKQHQQQLEKFLNEAFK